ncbi:hypothetical protein Pmani_038027 [Petrolisthes manimaculis]|uniref:Uncharacterized protein n=1 Tax=Petrolisthes manimaculis TaxID=1843537 RepID=A0AAE1TKM0_9EUCA|nr:hypothetical protein Pmani_038027 [Petrolisthes manimaculis]
MVSFPSCLVPSCPTTPPPPSAPASHTNMATHSSFHIHFMGDSKIRELFYVFLERMDGKFHFNIKLGNDKVQFLGFVAKHPQLQEDMEATSSAAQGLQVGFRCPVTIFCFSSSFRCFYGVTLMEVRESPEVKQLERWASGEDTPPHLLVIGYTSWQIEWVKSLPLTDVLSFLMEVHHIVVPLLYKISQRTHVLVVPQHRTRNYLDTPLNKGNQNYQTESNFDWSEMAFRHYLVRWSRGEGEASPLPRRQVSATPVFMSRMSGMDLVEPSDAPTHHNTTLDLIGNEYLKQHVTKDEEMGQHVVAEGMVQHVTEGEEVVQQVAADGVDHLSVRESGVGLWWWDTSLPLGLASISECQQLYHLGLTLHPLYIGKFLKCRDRHHAGTATLGDQVTMLLNLLCNSVFPVPKNACCH